MSITIDRWSTNIKSYKRGIYGFEYLFLARKGVVYGQFIFHGIKSNETAVFNSSVKVRKIKLIRYFLGLVFYREKVWACGLRKKGIELWIKMKSVC